SGTSNAYVPLPANLAGDFSNVLSASNPANPFGKATTVFDPFNLDPVTGQPRAFPNNQVPANRFDPGAVAFLKYLPSSPNVNGKIFYSQPLAQDFDEYLGRVDHSFGTKDRLSGRYFFDGFENAAFLAPHYSMSHTM